MWSSFWCEKMEVSPVKVINFIRYNDTYFTIFDVRHYARKSILFIYNFVSSLYDWYNIKITFQSSVTLTAKV